MTFMKAILAAGTAVAITTTLPAYSGMRSEQFDVPAGEERFVGEVPIFGEACFTVRSKDNSGLATGHFRGLINGDPIDLDRHFGIRCLKFVRGGCCLYRVYVIAEEGQNLIVTRTVNEENHDWRPGATPN
ncbi:MAG: hypothetical protein E5Y15_28565 [Mesorhizobium sp.]|nr:MAG: hypothetical protein E5Y15_28565 [Mesorhizobium sp.]